MGDVDLAEIGDLPSSINEKGESKLDQEMMELIKEYLNRYDSILGLTYSFS
jgi:hypothetical protein